MSARLLFVCGATFGWSTLGDQKSTLHVLLCHPLPSFLRQSFTELGALLLAKLIWQQISRIPYPCLPGIKDTYQHTSLFNMGSGIELRSPFLHSKHFPNLATSPAPRWGLLSDTVSKSTLNTPTFPLVLINPEKITLLAASVTAFVSIFLS